MSAQIDAYATLREKLSPSANIYVQNSKDFGTATLRWSQYKSPDFTVVVEVAIEDDVVETIKYANANQIPFLAYSGGHGAIAGLASVQKGIQISLAKLDSVEISETGTTATFGGGILSKKAIDTLWKAGKQTVTGCCEATSLLGPGLGGGHGLLQGKYGLISDQFVSARIVLADGTVKNVSSASSDPDLWWALQGAGHNFGIVTSVTMKIYDAPNEDIWSFESYVYTQDKVEGLYERINALWPDGSQPSGLINFSVLMRNPAVDAEKPILIFFIIQNGCQPVESIYTQPFRDLGSVFTQSGSGAYTDIPGWIGLDEKSPSTMKQGLSVIRFPVNVQNYNLQAQREVYELFAKETSKTPEFSNSYIMFEGYPVHGVKAVPSESSAFPHRDDNIIIAPVVTYDNKANDPELDAKANQFGEKLRQTIFAASCQRELHAYANLRIWQ
ncbi:FAD-linked oxidoreductase afoF [Talaromyces pinophilus]|nr:FAD-linked oxidoreductase afoF [Talaromyces pinophilus]